MTSPNNIIETRKEMARLNQWGAALELTIAETQCELEVVEKLKSANAEALDALMAAARRAGRRRVTLDDIKGCDTQREVLRFVDEANFGLAHLGEVAELVVDAKMSKTDKDSVRSTLHHYVNDSDDFVHIGKSWVWLLEFGLAPTLEEVEGAETAEQEGDGKDEEDTPGNGDETDLESGGEPATVPALFRETAVEVSMSCSSPDGR